MYSTQGTASLHIRNFFTTSVIALILAFAGSFSVYAGEIAVTDSVATATVPDSIRSSETPAAPVRSNRPVRPQRRNVSPIQQMPDTINLGQPDGVPTMVIGDSILPEDGSIALVPVDSVLVLPSTEVEKKFTFMPDPTRAVWMSALFPGLGQLYNRRYWKLPIVIGGFMGLGYAMSWNSTMLSDYTTAYSDIMDNDPTTKSYMDFFAPTVKEESLDKSWLTNLLRTRKNYFRRNRDLCVICMIGVYLIAMVDAYVDAQLAHFDISPSLSMDVVPTLMNNDLRNGSSRPGIGLYWALNF